MKPLLQLLVVLGIAALAVAILAPKDFVDKAKRQVLKGWEQTTSPSKARKRSIPIAAERLAAEAQRPLQEVLPQFDYAVSKAPRFRVQGRVVAQLPEGHLFITAHLLQRDKVVAMSQVYALFGHPNADTMKENDPVNCAVCTLGVANFTVGGKDLGVEEIIYIPDEAAAKPGAWLFDAERTGTSLDRKK